MRAVSFTGLALASILVSGVAEAQATQGTPKGAGSSPARSSAQFTLRRDAAGGADAQIARSRARAGDCAAALSAFDAAIRTTIDPTLRRDRGLCHEKLNHPWPAIDDYRAYLVERPEAPDSDDIRQRLAALEAQVGAGGPASESSSSSPSEGEGDGEVHASGSVSIGSGGAKASASSSESGGDSAESTETARSYDYYAAREKKLEMQETSPLRSAEGVILGAFLHIPRYFVGEGTSSDLGYGVGGTLRWATGPTLSLITEFGYVGIGTQGANSSSGGPLVMGGVELRIPVTRYASDQVLLRGGVGFERYKVSGTQLATNLLLGRFGLGFRHVFGPSVGFEVLFDGGPALAMPQVSDNRLIGLLSGSGAFLVAF